MRGVSSIPLLSFACAVLLMTALTPSKGMAAEPSATESSTAASATTAAGQSSAPATTDAASADKKVEPKATPNVAEAKAEEEKEPRDYYARRAKKILEDAAHAYDSKPHPLAKDYPDDFVTVCEAGCRGRKVEVTSRVSRKPVYVVESGALITASAKGGDVSKTGVNALVCLGGCRKGSEVLSLTPQATLTSKTPEKTLSEADIRDFKTTIGPESGRWMDGGSGAAPVTN